MDGLFQQNGKWSAMGGWNNIHAVPHMRKGLPTGQNILYLDWHVDFKTYSPKGPIETEAAALAQAGRRQPEHHLVLVVIWSASRSRSRAVLHSVVCPFTRGERVMSRIAFRRGSGRVRTIASCVRRKSRQRLGWRCCGLAMGVVVAELSPAAMGQATWVGDTSTDWNDATNWSSDPNPPGGNITINTTTAERRHRHR